VITADFDRELAAAVRALAADGTLTFPAPHARADGTWQPAQDGDPLGYATALPLKLAALTGADPAGLAHALAGALGNVPWVVSARPDGGYVTVTVTAQALAASAAGMAATPGTCANSAILAGTTVTTLPWPDLSAAGSWTAAWHGQIGAATSHLALAAGAADLPDVKRGRFATRSPAGERPEIQQAVAYRGTDEIRYLLTRTRQDDLRSVAAALAGEQSAAGGSLPTAGPLYQVQLAHVSAVSTLRWSAELGLNRAYPAGQLGVLLARPAERQLLSLLSFLPVRVAAAARRYRPDGLPRYLEEVSAAWRACQLEAPALPFGGAAAPGDPDLTAGRLELAAATAVVLSAGLALIGIEASQRV
jgi:DALR anticodon binding domain